MRTIKLTTLTIALVTILAGCKSQVLNVPDHVTVNRDNSHIQFPGTRVFMVPPSGYELKATEIRFQKNDSTFIQATEVPSTSFNRQRSAFDGVIDSAKIKGLNVYYKKAFKLGDYDAFILYGQDTRPGMDQMVLLFGNDNFVTMVAGELPANDPKVRQEVLAALLTTYVDTAVIPDYSVLMHYTVDLSNTQFQYRGNASQMFYYTINGQGDPANDPFIDQILITPMPAMEDFDMRKNIAHSMIDRYRNAGMTIGAVNEQKITINGLDAWEVTFSGSFQARPFNAYEVVVGDDKATILYCGSTYNGDQEILKQIKDLAQTLRTK